MTELKETNPKDLVGVKKASIHFVPMAPITEVSLAFLEGHVKGYGGHNYRHSGVKASVYLDAVWRHFFQRWWDCGEDNDADSGLSNITSAIACLLILRDSMIQGNFVDDRPIRSKVSVDELNSLADSVVEKFLDAKKVPAYTQADKDAKEAVYNSHASKVGTPTVDASNLGALNRGRGNVKFHRWKDGNGNFHPDCEETDFKGR